jgi:hypothetical protein
MQLIDIRNWIYTEFSPSTLSIGQPVIDQQILNCIRYWNTHSGYKITKMYQTPANMCDGMVTLDTELKNVVKVYPSVMEDALLQTSPMGTLLGFVTLDSLTTDLIMMTNAMEGYRIYLGQDFRWRYERSVDQDNVPGQLFLQKVPRGSSAVAVVGLKWIQPGENITDPFLLDWILKYSLALCKVKEGNILRHAQMISIQNVGTDMLKEGVDEIVELQTRLSRESQWALLAARK